ncbi:DJ-1/PfpI family protein [Thermodesulfobacteriota bacterium]
MSKKNTAIFIFEDVEVLDFTGPFEVFSVTNQLSDYSLMNIYIVAEKKEVITAKNGLSVNPDYAMNEAPTPDILIVPGGRGTRPLLQNVSVIEWIRNRAESAERVLSVCTGSLLLAQAGILDGLRATTHHLAFEELKQAGPNVEILKNERFVDNGKVVTSAGVSAGIDMSLHVIGSMYDQQTAQKTAAHMEYRMI